MAPRVVQTKKNGTRYVIDLAKSLYGVAQSPRIWSRTNDQKLIIIGFVPLKSDTCVYIYQHEGTTDIITLYVDDLLIVGCNITVIKAIKTMLMEKLIMRDLGDVPLVLFMHVTRNRSKGSLTICQRSCSEYILERFRMDTCKHLTTSGYGLKL